MANDRYGNIANSELDQTLSIVATPNQELDSAGANETRWHNDKWGTWNGYYRTFPEIKAQITKLAKWTIGKGFNSDAKTKKELQKIKGFGKDTFNGIIQNQFIVMKINGDSFAEIIKDKAGRLINLKPLNPGNIITVANKGGVIIGYEQIDPSTKKSLHRWDPEEIFHLCNDREGDEIHGISCLEPLEPVLKNIKQLDNDMIVVFHRFVVPMIIWKLDTDDDGEIAKFKTKADKAVNDGDNMYIPKDAVEAEILKVAEFANLNPLDWRKEWVQLQVKSTGMPELILGKAEGVTEASAKIVYLAFQQTVEEGQLFLEEQIQAQLNKEVTYEFPARIEENLGEDEGKDGKINTGKRSEVKISDGTKDTKAVSPK